MEKKTHALSPTAWNCLNCFLQERSGTLFAMRTGHRTVHLTGHRTEHLSNSVCYLHQNSPEPHQPSALRPSGTSSTICTGTLRNLIRYLPRNSPEPHQPSAPELSGTSSAICTRTLRNLISHLHRKALEPSTTFSGTWCCSCTGSHQSYSGLQTP